MNLIKMLLHKKDPPNSTYGREWRYWLNVSKWSISWELQLIAWDNIPQKPKMVCAYGVTLDKEWKIESNHTYYDGHNCSWQLGPVIFYKSGFGSCDKCNPHP